MQNFIGINVYLQFKMEIWYTLDIVQIIDLLLCQKLCHGWRFAKIYVGGTLKLWPKNKNWNSISASGHLRIYISPKYVYEN